MGVILSMKMEFCYADQFKNKTVTVSGGNWANC